MVTPTSDQLRVRNHEGLALLAVAPAGCGKTEALALRVAGLLERGVASVPRRVLVVTFSNRARDNIRDRLHSYLSPAQMRDRVSVSNFHGLSARIFHAHAGVIGLDPEMASPEADWVGDQCRSRSLSFTMTASVQRVLRVAKQKPATDDDVEQELLGSGNAWAIEIEQQRRDEHRLTYDDLPRLAELILLNPSVADLYQSHFAAVIVDEFQDLTPQQLRLVNRIGQGRTTYAGDLAQGIYGFAGAKPDEVYLAIQGECPDVIELSESHRSSPAILGMVNSLSGRTGGTALSAADPSSWPGGGLAGSIRFPTTATEARWAIDFSRFVLNVAPKQRIAIISRTVGRRRFVDAAVATSGLPFFRWDDGILDTETARLIKAMLGSLDLSSYQSATDKLSFLRAASGIEEVHDPDIRTTMADAIAWVYDLLEDGASPSDIQARIQVGDETTLLSVPGVHLLTGHVGKGQQFDWVVVIGAEEGTIPDFRATTSGEIAEEARILSVMISRARHGALITHAAAVAAASSGVVYPKDQTRFYTDLQGAGLLDAQGITDWLNAADWDAIAVR